MGCNVSEKKWKLTGAGEKHMSPSGIFEILGHLKMMYWAWRKNDVWEDTQTPRRQAADEAAVGDICVNYLPVSLLRHRNIKSSFKLCMPGEISSFVYGQMFIFISVK